MKIEKQILLIAILGCLSCSKPAIESSRETDPDKEKITDVAKKQAKTFVSVAEQEMKAQDILLNVRANETKLKQVGKSEMADEYIKSFIDEVYRQNPTLADTIFN